MAFTGNCICTSFKVEVLKGLHVFPTHTFKLALYDSTATLNAATTDYTTTGEITGTGYSAGGITLTAATPTSSGTTALTDFDDATIASATLTARGGLIYNTTAGGGVGTTNAVAVLDFGSNKSATAQDFTITFPTADALNAIVRIR